MARRDFIIVSLRELLVVGTIRFNRGAYCVRLNALITKGDSTGAGFIPAHDLRPGHFAVFGCIRAAKVRRGASNRSPSFGVMRVLTS
jgi:hypothetical protein